MSDPPISAHRIAEVSSFAGPKFLVLERQRLPLWVVLLAALLAAAVLLLISVGLRHSRGRHLREDAAPYARGAADASADDDKDDDPNQVDVIALGDAADAPVPARRFGHGGNVHPTIIVHLPRFGPQEGLIPNSAVGHLLYGWLAAFNQTNATAMEDVLPSAMPGMTAEAQMELRQQTGGFSLLSAKEVAPGVLVFRMRDQTPMGTEVLGTLVMRPGSEPAKIQSFSMRAVAAGE
ncbi:hypothetical protein [Terriglobus sp.]|uniref:hypothetical protein n=1 Tax=Terriglobus sp. TaxID=1889013 RepID=UPI003B0087CB